MDGCINNIECINGRINCFMNASMHECINECLNEGMNNAWMIAWKKELIITWMNEWIIECAWMHEC